MSLAVAARVGNELAGDRRDFPRGHVFVRRGDDGAFLRLRERALLENLIVPQKVGVQRRAAMRRDGGGDAIVILWITLRFLERLLAARRAATEIGILRRLAVIGRGDHAWRRPS